MTNGGRGTKTSIDLLQERDALLERNADLERALATIALEIEHAFEHPEIQHLVLCRIATLVKRARVGQKIPPLARTKIDAERASGARVGTGSGFYSAVDDTRGVRAS
jgi:hypothetical protein